MGLFSRPENGILLVCTANICRSPMAEGLVRFELSRRGMLNKYLVASAGTHATQPGRAADPRAVQVCERNGIDISKSRARQVHQQHFARFDYILAMDRRNYDWLVAACPESFRHKLSLINGWTAMVETEVIEDIPDPYFGNQEGFAQVFTALRHAVLGFVEAKLSG